MGEALTVEVRHEQGCAIVAAAGEIDISTVIPFRERLFEVAASGAPLVVDLEQVSFIDSVRARYARRRGEPRCRAWRQPAGGLRPAENPPASTPDRAGLPDTAGPHPGRGAGVPGSYCAEPAFLGVSKLTAILPASPLNA